MGIAFIIFMGLFIKCCAVHIPSTNPKKPPARRISDTLTRPMNTLRRMVRTNQLHLHIKVCTYYHLKDKRYSESHSFVHAFYYLSFLLKRHPHGGGGAGPRSIPPRPSQGGHGTRGPSHGYGEGRGAQYYPKGELAY